jgi:hypothetical protein
MVYNDAVQGLALSPYGMTDASRYQVQHLAGQKQYEFTNHLGNVQATISDLPVKVGEAHTEYHAPALPAVYDYYPFGMLMPDRYTSDTSSECVTVSQTKWVTTWVTHCYLAADWVWPAYSYYGTVSVSTSSGLQIAASESSGVYFEMDVLPYEQQDVYLQTDAFYSGSGTLELQEYHGGQWHMLGSTTFDKLGEVRISIRPREDRIRAVLRGPFYVQVKQFCVQRPQLSQETVLVDICDTDGDKYRFGYNGQEKVNEWAGIGNHNTALFWEYDTRTGRRLNLDPESNTWESPYATFGNNSILNTDILGNKWVTSSATGTVWDSDVKSKSDLKKYDYGDDARILEDNKQYESPNGKKFTLLQGPEWKDDKGEIHKVSDQRFEGGNHEKRKTWLAKGDNYVNTYAPKNIYKIVASNPVAQMSTAFWSSVTGHDMIIPSWDDALKNGGNVSGKQLSTKRRLTTGTQAGAQFVSLGYGGFLFDWAANAGANKINELQPNNYGRTNGVLWRSSLSIFQFYRDVKTQPLNSVISTTNSFIGISAGEADVNLQNEEKAKE